MNNEIRICIISNRFYHLFEDKKVHKIKLKNIKYFLWDDDFGNLLQYSAIIIDFTFEKETLIDKHVQKNIKELQNVLTSTNIENDNMLITFVCGFDHYSIMNDIEILDPPINEFEDELSYTNQFISPYDIFDNFIPGYNKRYLYVKKGTNPITQNIKNISMLQYFEQNLFYHHIYRYEESSTDCKNIYPIAMAKKGSNACIAFELRIGKGIIILLPSNSENNKYCCSILLKICKNYHKVREEYSDFIINFSIPFNLKIDYTESLLCFLNDLYKASCIMSRRTLEHASKLKGATKHRLTDKLDELFEMDKIRQSTKNSMDMIRKRGNDYAHPNLIDAVFDNEWPLEITEKDAYILLNLVKRVLEDLFTYNPSIYEGE